ncbi:MAG: acyl-CoA dehydrogenase family protein [Chloroflexota bacterium]
MKTPDEIAAIPAPEPMLTAADLIARASSLRPLLVAHQAECETLGRVSDEVNAELVKAGFYRTVQPRRFGGYEFDVPTFYRVMMEVSRGCMETGWVLALTAGHPMLLAAFPLEGQAEAYGPRGEFRGPAAFNPPGTAVAVEGGYRVSGAWVSASGVDIATHFIGSATVRSDEEGEPGFPIQFVLARDEFEIVDDWQVMGMQGTGSKTVRASDQFVAARRTVRTLGTQRGVDAERQTDRLYDNPMYRGRVGPFLIGEATAVAVGGARAALDLFAQSMLGKRGMFPPHLERTADPEYQGYYGRALALVSTAEAALVRAGEDFMDYAHAEADGGEPFGRDKELRLSLIEQQCVHMAWEALDLIFRTAGTTASAKQGAALGRIFRDLAVINTHPALQLERTGLAAAKLLLDPPPAPAPAHRLP